MKPQCAALLASAESKLNAARILLAEDLPGDAASRAYYAAFHAMSALHLAYGQTFSSHAQVIGRFNKDFVKSGDFPAELTRVVTRLFEDRQTGDYDVSVAVPMERAHQDLIDAERVVAAITEFLLKDAADADEDLR